MSKYLIRPHHMLCMQFFEGKGYSDGFVASMAAIKEKLEKEDPQVEIVEGTDDVCKNCPHNMGGACENEDSVRQHDKRVYDKVIETVGNSAKWSSITKAIRENIVVSVSGQIFVLKIRIINIYFKQPKGAWLYAMHLLCYMRLDLIFAIAKQYRYKSATKQYRYKSR